MHIPQALSLDQNNVTLCLTFFIIFHFSFLFIFIFSLFHFFVFFHVFPPRDPSGPLPPGLSQNIDFYYENLDFKARIWVREERKKRKEKKRKKKEKKRKEKKKKERTKERKNERTKERKNERTKERRKKNAPTKTGPLPQSHAQDLFVIRVRGNPSLRQRPSTVTNDISHGATPTAPDLSVTQSRPVQSFCEHEPGLGTRIGGIYKVGQTHLDPLEIENSWSTRTTTVSEPAIQGCREGFHALVRITAEAMSPTDARSTASPPAARATQLKIELMQQSSHCQEHLPRAAPPLETCLRRRFILKDMEGGAAQVAARRLHQHRGPLHRHNGSGNMEPEVEPFNTDVAEAHHVRQLLTWLVRYLHGLHDANCPLGKDLTVPESSNATTANSALFLQLARPFSSLAPLFIPKRLLRTGMLWRRENPRESLTSTDSRRSLFTSKT